MKLESICTPTTQLKNGTRVGVKGDYGVVIDSEIVPATPNGFIVVHTIHFDHTFKKVTPRKWKRVEIDKTKKVNYSFIRYSDRLGQSIEIENNHNSN